MTGRFRCKDPQFVNPAVGLCSVCDHARIVRSDRGSLFYLCQRSLTDKRFAAYPRLPVIECAGFQSGTTKTHFTPLDERT